MSKTSQGQYFLRNCETQKSLRECHDKFRLYVLCIFRGLLKLNPSEFLQF